MKNKSIIYYFIPPAVCLLTIVFWILGIKFESIVEYVSTFSIIFNAVVVPLYLIVLNLIIKNVTIIKRVVFSFSSSILSIIIHYVNYGITTKTFFSPDLATMIILFYEFVIACVVLLVFFVVAGVFKLMKNNR